MKGTLYRLGAAVRGLPGQTRRLGQPLRLPPDFEDGDIKLWQMVAPYTMTTPERMFALRRATEYVVRRGFDGAVVECGVWKGGSMMVVAQTLLDLCAVEHELYLFDTFEGMPAPGEEDVSYAGESAAELLERDSPTGAVRARSPLQEVREAVLGVGYPEQRIHFVAGRVEDTLPASAPEQISLLRLDTDWYESTRHELVHLYPRLVEGGVLIVDDYGHWLGARRAVDEYFAKSGAAPLLNRIDYTGRIAVKI